MLKHITIILLCLLASTVYAQESTPEPTTCPIIEAAYSAIENACGTTGRFEACYGGGEVMITPRTADIAPIFQQAGDVISLFDAREFVLNATDSTWPALQMNIRANLPNTQPESNITLLAFGTVQLQNNAPLPPLMFPVTINEGLNVRGGPSTNYPIVAGISGGETATAIGRNRNGDWFNVILPTGVMGWIYAPATSHSGDPQALENTPPRDELMTPMQSLSLSSGTASICDTEQTGGILLQTPVELPATILINGVQLELDGTAHLYTAEQNLYIQLLSGLANVAVGGVSVSLVGGQMTDVPLALDGSAGAPPSPPQGFERESLAHLPLLALPQPITLASAPTPTPPPAVAPVEDGAAPAEDAASETTAEAPDPTAATGIAGNWYHTDVDGSNVAMTITRIGEDEYAVYLYDNLATACARFGGATAAEGTGRGQLVGAQMTIQMTAVCLNDGRDELARFEVTYTYDAAENTLRDSFGTVWTR